MTELDLEAAHHRFAVECFNGVWDLLEKEDRSDDDLAEMIHMAHASLWHWRRSEHGDPQHFAVGAWQLSRVYAVAGHPEEARRYGDESLLLCRQHELAPFYLAYAYEALARAAAVAGDDTERERQLGAARAVADRVEDESNRQALLDDLATI
jgi:ATP/maltotriose-dependent transcriptional regulator MalT